MTHDVIIVGGGPGGLSAALVLGRARRRVLVLDSGEYRNHAARALHGFLSRDGIAPAELRRIGREEIARYESVELRWARASAAHSSDGGFVIRMDDGREERTRKLIVATGVVDELPPVDGAERLFGRGVHHCPYCDGWELRDRPLAVYGRGESNGAGLALELTLWSGDIILCTDGPSEIGAECLDRLGRHSIPVITERIVRLEGSEHLERVVFASGRSISRAGLFFNTDRHQRSDIARQLGCDVYESRGCRVDDIVGKTRVPGLYVVGDASRDVLQVVVAAAEGAAAAISVNGELLHDDGVL